VSDALRVQILACRDLGMLDLWAQRAAVLSSAEAVVRTPRVRSQAGRSKRTPGARKKA
jgi:hypothetical protein